MVLHDKELASLVSEQFHLFLTNAPEKDKIDVLKRIEKRQAKLRVWNKGDCS